jgi:hypothetical protein
VRADIVARAGGHLRQDHPLAAVPILGRESPDIVALAPVEAGLARDEYIKSVGALGEHDRMALLIGERRRRRRSGHDPVGRAGGQRGADGARPDQPDEAGRRAGPAQASCAMRSGVARHGWFLPPNP